MACILVADDVLSYNSRSGHSGRILVADDYGTSPIAAAAQQGWTRVVVRLAAAQADVNRADARGRTPLWLTVCGRDRRPCHTGHRGALIALLEAKADCNIADVNGIAPAHLVLQRYGSGSSLMKDLTAAGAEMPLNWR